LGQLNEGGILAQALGATKLRSTATRKYSTHARILIHQRFILTAQRCAPFLSTQRCSFAQSTAAPAPAKKTEKPRSAASLACSKQADEKGLHGKERKKFRSDCMKEAKGTADKAK
jgi:hypothetical protein